MPLTMDRPTQQPKVNGSKASKKNGQDGEHTIPLATLAPTLDLREVDPKCVEFVDVKAIEVDPSQPRVIRDDAEDEAFREAVKVDGYIRTPVEIWRKDGRVVLVTGHRRLEAARAAEFATIPCIDVTERVQAMSEAEFRNYQARENEQRLDMHFLDTAATTYHVWQAGEKAGMTQTELAVIRRRSQPSISHDLTIGAAIVHLSVDDRKRLSKVEGLTQKLLLEKLKLLEKLDAGKRDGVEYVDALLAGKKKLVPPAKTKSTAPALEADEAAVDAIRSTLIAVEHSKLVQLIVTCWKPQGLRKLLAALAPTA